MNTKTTSTLAGIAIALLALAGCAPATDAAVDAPTGATQADSVVISDAWVKSAEEGMSAAFGILANSGTTDAVVVSASTEASPMIELHETVENDSGEMVMQQKDGGFVIPAGSDFALEPGGNHIMLMGLTAPLAAGEEVSFTLTFEDGSEYTFDAPVKDYSGANENYEGGDDMNMEMDGE